MVLPTVSPGLASGDTDLAAEAVLSPKRFTVILYGRYGTFLFVASRVIV